MTTTAQSFVYTLPTLPKATAEDCARAAQLLQERTGIVLGAHKEDMIARSLGLRAKHLHLATVKQYLDHLAYNVQADEWDNFINTFTINHTAFFRERHHFDVLGEFVATRAKPIAVWSSAASTGEEAYSIAMTLRESIPNVDVQVSVLASDVDTAAIAKAKQGIYGMDRVMPVPEPLLKKYFQRGKGAFTGRVRVKPALRELIDFQVVNLISTQNWPEQQKFDAIFCRNTMISFERETQIKLLNRFAQQMKPGALLFVGHSENISQLSTAFRLKGQTVYVRV